MRELWRGERGEGRTGYGRTGTNADEGQQLLQLRIFSSIVLILENRDGQIRKVALVRRNRRSRDVGVQSSARVPGGPMSVPPDETQALNELGRYTLGIWESQERRV